MSAFKRLHKFTVCIVLYTSMVAIHAQDSTEDKQKKVGLVMEQYIAKGLPGLSLGVLSGDHEYYEVHRGFSNLSNKEILSKDHFHYLQSVSKTYMAVGILRLMEKGKLALDDHIDNYLSAELLGTFSERGITIRQLLNHTSGIPDYASYPPFVAKRMENLTAYFTAEDCIISIHEQPLDFNPGTNYAYSNTNYTLLALIGDALTGDHITWLENEIFKPLQLEHTVYLTPKNLKDQDLIVHSYWDPLNLETPVDVSNLQKVNVASLRGDDGIVCTVSDASQFLKGLIKGKLLQPETMKEMLTWIEKDGRKRYGLGITYYDLGDTYGIGHSGGGLGAGCILLYLPEKDITLFLATNFSTMIESKITQKCATIQSDILAVILE